MTKEEYNITLQKFKEEVIKYVDTFFEQTPRRLLYLEGATNHDKYLISRISDSCTYLDWNKPIYVLGEKINLSKKVVVCPDCGNEFFRKGCRDIKTIYVCSECYAELPPQDYRYGLSDGKIFIGWEAVK